jgi:hypothetical protein
MQRADVIHMSVSCHGAERFAENARGRLAQTGDPQPGVDEQVAVASLNVPDVTLHDPDDVGFPYPGHPIREVLEIKPTRGDLQGHRAQSITR